MTPLETAAQLALDSVHREYPNHIGHLMTNDGDACTPRQLHPAFYGCFDWHSAVHSHWLLARLARLHPDNPLAASALKALEQSLTEENLNKEADYMMTKGRDSFERPYGLAWLLLLAAECRGWNEQWTKALRPLETLSVERLSDWAQKLPSPVRTGTHGQTAFSFGLTLDYARKVKNDAFAELIETASRRLFGGDRNGPIAYEPSGHDFLSPCLSEADLMRRVLTPPEFATWLSDFLPLIPMLTPSTVPDKSDGQLAHLDGLNLSRAWMLDGIAENLTAEDPRKSPLKEMVKTHKDAGLASLSNPHYMGSHWLGTFAAYLTTKAYLEHPKVLG